MAEPNQPLSGIASALAAHGRYGDTELLHVNRAELEMLEAMSPGGLTINPATGQKEAFLPFLIPLLSSALAPSLAGILGTGTGLTTAMLSGLGTWAATGDAKQGLLSGLLGGLGGKLLGGAGDLAKDGVKAGAEAAMNTGADLSSKLGKDALAKLASGVPNAAGASTGMAAHAAMNGLTNALDPNGLTGMASQIAQGGKTAMQGGLGGALDWVKRHPMMTAALAAGAGSAMGGKPDPVAQSGGDPYREANWNPRNIVPYGQPGPSTYVGGDTSQDGSIYRYGQNSGEHMFFDRTPSLPGSVNVSGGGPSGPTGGFPNFTMPTGGVGIGETVLSNQDKISQTPKPGYEPVQIAGQTYYINNSGGLGAGMTQLRAAGGPVFGPGNGQSDNIPAQGPGGTPYQLSNDEFVIPADVVSALGAGSSNAGHQELSAMLERVRQQAYGTQQQQQPVDPRVMPA